MSPIPAWYYDGKTSARREVQLHFDPDDRVRVTGLAQAVRYRLSEVRVAPRVGDTPRLLTFPDGATCETADNEAIDAMMQRGARDPWHTVLHLLESRWHYVLLLLFLTLTGTWAAIEHGIPALAKQIAQAVPPSVDETLGREGLQALDRVLFTKTRLDPERQRDLRARFDRMVRDLQDGHRWRLELRSSVRAGPNAFALPSRIVILTDELVLLAEHPRELTAVLAHEIGHVQHRHALRRLLQNSVTVLLLASLTGDLASVTALSSALPTVLLEAKYSRDFETEADRFALAYLRAHAIPPAHFIDILERIEANSDDRRSLPSFLSTHPPTEERARMFHSTREAA